VEFTPVKPSSVMTAALHPRFGARHADRHGAQDLADAFDNLRSLLAKLDRQRDGGHGRDVAAELRDRARRELDALAREADAQLTHLPAPRRTR
jgi:hypothetical protein